eukprot:743695-Prymnesium_polylepis.4
MPVSLLVLLLSGQSLPLGSESARRMVTSEGTRGRARRVEDLLRGERPRGSNERTASCRRGRRAQQPSRLARCVTRAPRSNTAVTVASAHLAATTMVPWYAHMVAYIALFFDIA